MASLISLTNVTREYCLEGAAAVAPIRNVSLEVQTGEFLMIVGRSGSGKTTLLNLCGGLIKPTSGQVLFEGVDMQKIGDRELSALRRDKIGLIFQFQSMLPNLTAIENVAMPATSFGNEGKPFQRAAELLTSVGLGDRRDFFPRQLSAGELKRVAIARALMNRPEIILADEPTADLDERTEFSVISLLRRIHESGVTVVMITHNLALVPYSTRALSVEDGGLMAVSSEQYHGRRPVVSSAGQAGTAAAGPDQTVAVPSSALTVRASRPGPHPLTFSLALAGAILGILALLVVLTRPDTPPPTASIAQNQGVAATGMPASATAPILTGVDALRLYDRLSASFYALMTFERYGSIVDSPVDLKVTGVPISWDGVSFSGQLEQDRPGVDTTYTVSGMVSDDGSMLLSLAYSREIVEKASSRGSLYRIILREIPLASGTSVTCEMGGPGMQSNIVRIEYVEGPLTNGQISPLTAYKSTDWTNIRAIPTFTLAFGQASAEPQPAPSGGM